MNKELNKITLDLLNDMIERYNIKNITINGKYNFYFKTRILYNNYESTLFVHWRKLFKQLIVEISIYVGDYDDPGCNSYNRIIKLKKSEFKKYRNKIFDININNIQTTNSKWKKEYNTLIKKMNHIIEDNETLTNIMQL